MENARDKARDDEPGQPVDDQGEYSAADDVRDVVEAGGSARQAHEHGPEDEYPASPWRSPDHGTHERDPRERVVTRE